MKKMQLKPYYLEDIAAQAEYTIKTVKKHIRVGKLGQFDIGDGGVYLFTPDNVRKYLEQEKLPKNLKRKRSQPTEETHVRIYRYSPDEYSSVSENKLEDWIKKNQNKLNGMTDDQREKTIAKMKSNFLSKVKLETKWVAKKTDASGVEIRDMLDQHSDWVTRIVDKMDDNEALFFVNRFLEYDDVYDMGHPTQRQLAYLAIREEHRANRLGDLLALEGERINDETRKQLKNSIDQYIKLSSALGGVRRPGQVSEKEVEEEDHIPRKPDHKGIE